MGCPLLGQIFSQIVPEGLVSQNAVANVRDKVQRVAEIAFNLFTLRLLLAGAINLVQERSHVTGGPAHVFLLLALDIEQILARTDAERVPHDVDRRILVNGRLRQPRDRKSTRLNSSHLGISYAVFRLKKQ